MPGPENELWSGLQPNPNEFAKCSSCGKMLQSKKEENVKLCKECQRRGKANEPEVKEGE
ncbi:hypothetical protein [Pontibacillus yanchengensis]|uniref:hypothetical protein n=1 Tax=Pontibacillus yanchengensis TaxID=462910 RepID=UPI000AAA93F5|nr:hypothetical protein [Pontibacillus yanchengensis]